MYKRNSGIRYLTPENTPGVKKENTYLKYPAIFLELH